VIELTWLLLAITRPSVQLAERRVALEQWAPHLVGLMELRVMTYHSHVPENSGEIGGCGSIIACRKVADDRSANGRHDE
jgi:hypothetical protein